MSLAQINPDSYYKHLNSFLSKKELQSELIEISDKSNILITSIHGVPHLRDGKIKDKDSGTLEFSYLLSQFSNSHFYGLNIPNILDNNYYAETPQKHFLTSFVKENNIQFILDIHASHSVRPHDIEIGSMDKKSLLGYEFLENKLMSLISPHFFCIANQIFKGEGSPGSETMVRFFSSKLGLPCLQIEINSSLINEDQSLYVLHQKSKLLYCFCEFIKQIKI